MTRGHVFVIRGDMTQLACDAWLLPTDGVFNITPDWGSAYEAATSSSARPEPPWLEEERVRLLTEGTAESPQIWLGRIGARGQDAAWYVEGAIAFVRAAAAALRNRPAAGRPPLLALPHVGTGYGGARHTKGEVLEALFRALYDLIDPEELDADVVVVSWDAPGHAAAQRARARALGGTESDLGPVVERWPFADPTRAAALGAHARFLAQVCDEGRLAVFMGAGVSVGAGLPDWTQLLSDLTEQLSEATRAPTRDDLERLGDPRDQAELLALRFRAEGTTLADQLAPRLRERARYSLQHGLLSSLRVDEFITTNFDELFEAAARAAGRTLRVIGVPGAADGQDSDRWLLKLHGTVSSPSSIVLTRSSYFEVPRQRGALFGLVQAMLMTRHMLFVGYGLRDEDFHELVNEVRLARAPAFRMDSDPGSIAENHRTEPHLGSAITLFDDPVHAEIWSGDVDVLAMLPSPDAGATTRTDPGREIELFLDLLGLLAANRTAFLLDPQYAGMLTEDEADLAVALGRLELDDFSDFRDGWHEVYALLERFGHPGGRDRTGKDVNQTSRDRRRPTPPSTESPGR